MGNAPFAAVPGHALSRLFAVDALSVAAGGLVFDPPSGRCTYQDIAVGDVGDAANLKRDQPLGSRHDLVAGDAVDDVADHHVLNRVLQSLHGLLDLGQADERP